MRIILKRTKEGGTIWIDSKDLTPEFLKKIEVDKDDERGWKKYRGKLKEHGIDI